MPNHKQTAKILSAMKAKNVNKLIHISSLGIYDELPGKFGIWSNEQIGEYLPPYRRAADMIEASEADYLIIRPAYLSDLDEVDYEITSRDEPFKGTEVSRKSIAAIVVKAALEMNALGRKNIGVNKPGTTGDIPSFMA